MALARLFILIGMLCAASAAPTQPYRQTTSIRLGTPDRWDYAVFDPTNSRLYVAHGDRLDVLDGRDIRLIGSVAPIPGGTHGTAIVHSAGEGFTDDGRNGTAVAFDLKTLKITHTLPAGPDADAIALDPRSGHVFVMEGDPGTITVIDPKANRAIATIQAGEELEYAVPGDGTLYVAGKEKRDVLAIDTRTNRIEARWAAPDCESPHGIAFDPQGRRLFLGCRNAKLFVMDASDGRVVASVPIGRGSDAVAYDPSHRRVFSSNGIDGTVTILQQRDADHYVPLDALATKVRGRTMAVDPHSGRLFVVAADTSPPASPDARPLPQPGTLAVLVYDPVP